MARCSITPSSAEHTCRGFRRLEYHLFVETYPLDLCSCTPKVHLLRVDFTSTSIPLNCAREDISQSLVTHTEPLTSNTNSKSSCAAPSCASFPNPPHMSLSVQQKQDHVSGLQQTEILREIVSCVDTLCGEAFAEHSLIDRTRIQHIKTRGRIHGSCSFLKSFGFRTFRLYLGLEI